MRVKLTIEIQGDQQTEPLKSFLVALSLYYGTIRRSRSRDALRRILAKLEQLLAASMVELLDCEIC